MYRPEWRLNESMTKSNVYPNLPYNKSRPTTSTANRNSGTWTSLSGVEISKDENAG